MALGRSRRPARDNSRRAVAEGRGPSGRNRRVSLAHRKARCPIPDSSYGNSAGGYQSLTDLSMPPAHDGTNPDKVTIPISRRRRNRSRRSRCAGRYRHPNSARLAMGCDTANSILARCWPARAVVLHLNTPRRGYQLTARALPRRPPYSRASLPPAPCLLFARSPRAARLRHEAGSAPRTCR